MDAYAENGPHGGLDHFGIETIHRIRRAVDGIDAEPIRHAEDSPQIAGIANAIQGQKEALFRQFRLGKVLGPMNQRQSRRRGGKAGNPGHGGLADLFLAENLFDLEAGGQGLGHQLFAFGHE